MAIRSVTPPLMMLDHPKIKRKRWLICGLYTVGITMCSLLPSKSIASLLGGRNIPLSDKIVHFGMYGVLAMLVMWALGAGITTKVSGIGVFIGCFFYGLLMEGLQSLLLPGDRYFSWGDTAANGLGALLGLAVFYLLIRRRRIMMHTVVE